MSSTRICGNCNAVVPEGHFYCGRCGASYNEDARRAMNETLLFGAMQAPGRGKLVLIQGKGHEGLSYHLSATQHVAGRSSGAILFPDDDLLSPKHATFLYRENKLHLRDENSLNGTFLRIRGPQVLKHGDEFLVGRELFRLESMELQARYPMSEDTMMYVSPPKEYRFRLVHVMAGGIPGAVYSSPHNQLTVGREGTDILFADDRHVSRQHARIAGEGGEVVLSDLGSRNGTFVRVREETLLHHGDLVFMGSELLRVEINA